MDQFLQFIINNWYLWLAFCVILALLIHHESRSTVAGVLLLSPQGIVEKINHEDAVVIDIRDATAYDKGHILQALHIPQSEINNKLNKLRKYKDKPLIVICENGQQSPQAGKLLCKEGFEEILSLKGGMRTWREADLPLAKGKGKSKGKKKE
ncbi:MAG: rhodanese-like domain-containing protein [Gammaproteobacteria bacterium]